MALWGEYRRAIWERRYFRSELRPNPRERLVFQWMYSREEVEIFDGFRIIDSGMGCWRKQLGWLSRNNRSRFYVRTMSEGVVWNFTYGYIILENKKKKKIPPTRNSAWILKSASYSSRYSSSPFPSSSTSRHSERESLIRHERANLGLNALGSKITTAGLYLAR